MDKVVLIGAGGHFKVVKDILENQYDIVGVTDSDPAKHNSKYYGINVLGYDTSLPEIKESGVDKAFITLGSTGDNTARSRLYMLAESLGFKLINVISESSIISKSAIMGKGNLISDRAVIHADAVIGSNVILNTGCIIEHDCVIEDNVHISPGALLGGNVRIGEGSHIGIGAVVIQGIKIGRGCVIGAGAVVIGNVDDNSVCVGVPAKFIRFVK